MKIFLSYSTPKNKEQNKLLTRIERLLIQNNIQYLKIDYRLTNCNPIFPIIDAIKKCDYLICIAFEKYHFNVKRKYFFYTSQWLDIELALAFQQRMQVLILKESHIEDSAIISNKFPPCDIINIKTKNYRNNIDYNIDMKDFKDNIEPLLLKWLEAIITS